MLMSTNHFCVFTKLIVYSADQFIVKLNYNVNRLPAVHFEYMLYVDYSIVFLRESITTVSTFALHGNISTQHARSIS